MTLAWILLVSIAFAGLIGYLVHRLDLALWQVQYLDTSGRPSRPMSKANAKGYADLFNAPYIFHTKTGRRIHNRKFDPKKAVTEIVNNHNSGLYRAA